MTRLEDVLNIVHGEIVCVADNRRNVYSCKKDLMDNDLYKNYVVTSISAENNAIVFELQPWRSPVADADADWVKEYKELNGAEPGFF